MDSEVAPLDRLAQAVRDAVTATVREAHAAGLPVFEADDATVFAVYPDGRRIAVEHLRPAPKRSNARAA